MPSLTKLAAFALLTAVLSIPSQAQPPAPNAAQPSAASAYPALGHHWRADYGKVVYRVAFNADGKTLRWAPFDEPFETAARTETYQRTYLRPGLFLVTWKEADGTTVTHVEDFESGVIHASVTLPDKTFLNLRGSWTRLP